MPQVIDSATHPHKNSILILFLLAIFGPVGIYLMWTQTDWVFWLKILITLFFTATTIAWIGYLLVVLILPLMHKLIILSI